MEWVIQKAHASLQDKSFLSPLLNREGSSHCLVTVYCVSTHLLFFPVMSLEGGLSLVCLIPLVSFACSVIRAVHRDVERGHNVF